MDTIKDMIAAQRAELAEVLAGLPGPGWDEPTLCAGWRVREVVASLELSLKVAGAAREMLFLPTFRRGRKLSSCAADRSDPDSSTP